jgi:hypothetical protein
MKILKLLLAVAVFTTFISCDKDDEKNPGSGTSVTGKWRLTELEYGGTNTSSQQDLYPHSTFTGTGFSIDFFMNFDENPNLYTSNGSYGIHLVTSIAGFPDMESNETMDGFANNGTWEITGSQIVMNSAIGGLQTGEIIELTASSLIIGVNDENIVDGGAITVTQTVSGTYTFIKE